MPVAGGPLYITNPKFPKDCTIQQLPTQTIHSKENPLKKKLPYISSVWFPQKWVPFNDPKVLQLGAVKAPEAEAFSAASVPKRAAFPPLQHVGGTQGGSRHQL